MNDSFNLSKRFSIIQIGILLACLSFAQSAFAVTAKPFLIKDHNPFVSIYNLPRISSARLINKSEIEVTALLDVSNTLNLDSNNHETLRVDGETEVFTFLFAYGLSDKWNLHLSIPVIKHHSGFLDDAIDGYHDLFGFPEGKRPSQENNQLEYSYLNDSGQAVLIDSKQSGVGDISLQLAYQVLARENFSLSLGGSIALPTGDVKKLTGSDTTDTAFWSSAAYSVNSTWQVFGSAGLLNINKNSLDVLSIESLIQFANLGLAWQLQPKFSMQAQIDMHTQFYQETDLRFLSEALQVSVGGRLQLSPKSSLDFAFTEDLKVDAAPDVSFHLGFRHSL